MSASEKQQDKRSPPRNHAPMGGQNPAISAITACFCPGFPEVVGGALSPSPDVPSRRSGPASRRPTRLHPATPGQTTVGAARPIRGTCHVPPTAPSCLARRETVASAAAAHPWGPPKPESPAPPPTSVAASVPTTAPQTDAATSAAEIVSVPLLISRRSTRKKKRAGAAACSAFFVGEFAQGARPNNSTPLVPPKPKEFDCTTSTRTSRAVFGM